MNKELKKLWEDSGLSKGQFSLRCGIYPQTLNNHLSGKFILKETTFKKYKENYENGKCNLPAANK